MKIPSRTVREAVDVCHGSSIYPHLTRYEKREAVIYCLKTMGKFREVKERR